MNDLLNMKPPNNDNVLCCGSQVLPAVAKQCSEPDLSGEDTSEQKMVDGFGVLAAECT
jgi:hypothetical protein